LNDEYEEPQFIDTPSSSSHTTKSHTSSSSTTTLSLASTTPSQLYLTQSSSNHLTLAKQILNTCVMAYQETSTGLCPEAINFKFDYFKKPNKKGIVKVMINY
jgi:hypothetical protein